MLLTLLLTCFNQASFVATTDVDGWAQLTLPHGTYRVTADAPDGWVSEERLIKVGENGAATVIVIRPAMNVWVRVLQMSGSRPDTVSYALYACPECKKQLNTIVSYLDTGPPIQVGDPCPLCLKTLTKECYRGIWEGGTGPIQWLGNIPITLEQVVLP